MKIAVDARMIHTSTGRYTHRLLQHLQELDLDNDYFVYLYPQDYDKWEPTNPNFHKVTTTSKEYTFREQIHFCIQLYRGRYDLVHFTMPQHPLLYLRPHIITVHDLTLIRFVNRRNDSFVKSLYRYKLKPAVFRLVLQLGLKKASHIITPTEFVRQDIRTTFGISSDKITFTHEAADALATKARSAREHIGPGKFVLYLSNAYPYKNVRRIIDAFKLLGRNDVKLVLGGKNDYFFDELKRYVQDENIKNVYFYGFVPDEELVWLYQHAELDVYPSLSEGFGLPPLEAMSYGCPVVASNATCLPEVLGEAAHYCDPYSTTDIARAMTDVLDDTKLRDTLKAGGVKQAKKYSWRRMAEQTLALYRAVLKQN